MEPKKVRSADLQRRRKTFFFMGLLFASAVALVAFEWRVPVRQEIPYEGIAIETLEAEMIDPSFKERPKPRKKSKKPTQKKITDKIEVVDTKEKGELKDLDLDVDEMIDETEGLEVPEKKPEEKDLFIIVEEMPSFPSKKGTNWKKALYEYIGDNLRIPQQFMDITETGEKGKVNTSFIINEDGSISDIKILRSDHPSLSREARRLLEEMPKWNPGKQRGVPVKVKMNLPLSFGVD